MTLDLSDLITQWIAMDRTHGEDTAEAFYEEHIFPKTVDGFVDEWRGKNPPDYDLLILTLGTSPAPVALCLLAVAVPEALILCTDRSVKCMRRLQSMVSRHGLPTAISYEIVEANDPLTVYGKIRDRLAEREYDRVAVNATGGTKAMVDGAAQAAGVLGADRLYVDNDEYLEDLRRPRPGSERLVRLPNPYEIFGDLKERDALRLAAQHQYARAADILADLPDATQAHVRYEIERLILSGYAQLEAMNFCGAKIRNPDYVKGGIQPSELLLEGGAQHLESAALVLQQALQQKVSLPFDNTSLTVVREQAEYATIVGEALGGDGDRETGDQPAPAIANDHVFHPLWSFIYNYGVRREETAQYDSAALCMYRCLELIPQRRLARLGISTTSPDWWKLDIGESELLKRFREVTIDGQPSGGLPGKITLMDGLKLLFALEDPLTEDATGELLKTTRGLVDSRNRSIFAHGLQRLDPNTYRAFRDIVDDWSRRLCASEAWDFAELQSAFRFLVLPTPR